MQKLTGETPCKKHILQNYGNSLETYGCQGLGQAGMKKWNTSSVYRSEIALYDTIMLGICYYTFAKTQRQYKTE